jgi:hypothetical protein
MGDRRRNDRQRLRSQRRELHSRGWTTGGADYHQRPPHSQSLEIPLHAARVCGASGRFTVITDLRLSPACTARATAQRGQRRTADLIPDWLTFPTTSTLHRGRANCRVNNVRPTRRLTRTLDPTSTSTRPPDPVSGIPATSASGPNHHGKSAKINEKSAPAAAAKACGCKVSGPSTPRLVSRPS